MFWPERHYINKCSISFLIYLTIFVLGFDLWKMHSFTGLGSSDCTAFLEMDEDLLEILAPGRNEFIPSSFMYSSCFLVHDSFTV